MLTPQYLAQLDGLMLMTNGNRAADLDQKKAIVDYVRNGHAPHRHALRDVDALRLSRVWRDVRRLLPPPIVATNKIGRRTRVC